jgi:hypothetical protein
MMQTHPHPPPNKSKPKLKLLSGSGTPEMSFESQLGQRVGMVTLNNFLWSTFKTNMTEVGPLINCKRGRFFERMFLKIWKKSFFFFSNPNPKTFTYAISVHRFIQIRPTTSSLQPTQS